MSRTQKYFYESGTGECPLPVEADPFAGTAEQLIGLLKSGKINWFYYDPPTASDYGNARQLIYNQASLQGVSIRTYVDRNYRLVCLLNGESE